VVNDKVEIQGVSYDSYYDSSSISRVGGNVRFWLKAITDESLPANPDDLVYAIYDEYMKNYRERQAHRDKKNEYIRRMNERKSRWNVDDVDDIPDYDEQPPIEFVPPQLPYLPTGSRTSGIRPAYTLMLIEIDCSHSQFAVVQQKTYTKEGKEVSNSTFSIPSWTPYSSYGYADPTANLMRTICR
jgi:hypothetical protein